MRPSIFSVLGSALSLPLLTLACGPGNATGDAGVDAPPEQVTELRQAEGGTAPSPDGSFSVSLDSNDLVGDVTVTITEVDDSPVPEASLSPAYQVDVEGEVAINPSAELQFTLAGDRVEEIGLQNIKVAHGETAGEEWDELLVGEYDGEDEVYKLTVSGFSYFMLVDESAVEAAGCECDTDGSCQADCSCDEDCSEAPSGECSSSCMSQSLAECCTTCGCDAEVVCTPACGSGYTWDCELGCCYDYDSHVCEGEEPS